MWKFLLLHCFLWVSSLQSELFDLLSMADQFFEEFQASDNLDPAAFKLMLKRTYNLDDNHKIHKRSLEADEKFIQDKFGVDLLRNIQDVDRIPVRFPNDINILSSHNVLYIAALEANGTNPESKLANDLVLLHYSSIQGIREMGRVPVLGGVKVAMYIFQNITYIIAAEHEANENPDLYQGSTVYKMVEKNGRVSLEKSQILNVIQPNDLKFWEHQDQLYLAVGTNMGNNTQRTGTLIYRWLGHHFDCLQVIPSKNVKSVMPFTIGSFMYLAIANYQDENGNLDINSEIYQFSLQDMKFKPFQKIKTHGATDISYFNFENFETGEKEHFLIVANSLGKNSSGGLTSLGESVVYKKSDNYFIPFQSFRLYRATQWVPIKGSNNEFLLLGSYANGVVGYQYDGWRFTPVSLQFGQSNFGRNIQSMRAFYYFGDLFLTIADKISHGNSVNLWKLSFTNKNELEKLHRELAMWCNEMEKNMTRDDFGLVLQKFNIGPENNASEHSKPQLTAENYKTGDMNKEIRDELEQLNEKTKDLENLLEKAEENLNKYKTQSELPVVLGSHELTSLELNCTTKDCCLFKNVKISKVNGENFTDFLTNVVPLKKSLTGLVLEFDNVTLEKDLSSTLVNGHPPETLINLSSDVFINAEFVVNGTVFINGDLNVSGVFDGVRPDKEHMLLTTGDQTLKSEFLVNSLKVKNLEMSGLLNGEPIEHLLRRPEIKIPSEYNEIHVNNMFVEGLVDGFNLTDIFNKTVKKSGNQVLQGNLNITSLEADEIIVESQEISNVSLSKIFEALEERFCQSDTQPFIEISPLQSFRSDSNEAENSKEADEYIMIVEGLLKAKEFSDESNTTSLLNIINNSLNLNESVINSKFQFSNIQADDLKSDFVNEVPISSWILKNAKEAQSIRGRKKFVKNVHIREEVIAEKINDVDLEILEGDVLWLKGDQIIRGNVNFNTVKCPEVKTNFTNFASNSFDKTNKLEIRHSVVADQLEVENLTLTGDVDSLSWERIVEDSVFENDIVWGMKTINAPVRVENLNITGRINDLLFEEFVALTSADPKKILLDRNITLNGPLTVEELHFEGLLNDVLRPNFEREWLLQDGTQIITGPVTFENVHMKSGSNLMNETIDNINLRNLFTKSLKINEDTKIKRLFSLEKAQVNRIDIGGTLNGADFKESIVRSKLDTPQVFSGDWFFTQGLTVNGSLLIEGHLSGLNLTRMCSLSTSDRIRLIVGGSVKLQREPIIVSKINNIKLSEKISEIWMRNEKTTLKGKSLKFDNVDFDNKTTVLGSLNNINLTDLSKLYLSKTRSRVISSDFEFDNLVIKKWCRMHEATAGGTVNGININRWAKNVLLQGEEQVIEENVRFEKFETWNLYSEGTVNGFNLSKDVLRFDIEDALVEGEKTFSAVNVLNLTLAKGRSLQGVDVVGWRKNSVKTAGDVVIKGDLELRNATFNGPFTVLGKVNNIYFDSKHLLTTKGNQLVTGIKHFDYSDRPDAGIKMKVFDVSGKIDGIDLDNLIRNQAYSDRNLVFKQAKTFKQGLKTDSMEVDGFFHGVDVSGMCSEVLNPVDVNSRKNEFGKLLNQTKALIKVVRDRAFFFDYFELIQTLKPQIKAVVPTLDKEGKYLLAIFTSNTMKFMDWNDFSERFVSTDEGLTLTNNITYVASDIFKNSSLLYIETAKSAKIFDPKLLKEMEGMNTSCIASFRLKSLDKSCIFIGQKWNSSRILCKSNLMNELQTYQYLDSKGSVQVVALNIEDETFIAVINKEVVFDKIENTLSIYRYDPKLQHFYVSHTLAEINPVALSSITYKNNHYLVSAGGHLPESVHNSILSIFRFNKRHKVFVRAQSIQVDTPVDVHFAILPSSQLALYVLTSNPTKPFVVFLHKGITGFVEETSGLSLYPGTQLYSYTDLKNRHFVIISGFGKGQILKAGFKGDKAIEE